MIKLIVHLLIAATCLSSDLELRLVPTYSDFSPYEGPHGTLVLKNKGSKPIHLIGKEESEWNKLVPDSLKYFADINSLKVISNNDTMDVYTALGGEISLRRTIEPGETLLWAFRGQSVRTLDKRGPHIGAYVSDKAVWEYSLWVKDQGLVKSSAVVNYKSSPVVDSSLIHFLTEFNKVWDGGVRCQKYLGLEGYILNELIFVKSCVSHGDHIAEIQMKSGVPSLVSYMPTQYIAGLKVNPKTIKEFPKWNEKVLRHNVKRIFPNYNGQQVLEFFKKNNIKFQEDK